MNILSFNAFSREIGKVRDTDHNTDDDDDENDDDDDDYEVIINNFHKNTWSWHSKHLMW